MKRLREVLNIIAIVILFSVLVMSIAIIFGLIISRVLTRLNSFLPSELVDIDVLISLFGCIITAISVSIVLSKK